ncbi:MAG: SpoIIE family protein phosphatase [Gemmataceae bacterium]|nr:SpoIIE family protein phosphatase [Gemmataceae bacterium]
MPLLVVLKGSLTNRLIPLRGERLLLGRHPDCDVVIRGEAVSREHAQITYADGKYYIEDLNSRNHTYVNERQITERTELKENDQIRICDFLFAYVRDSASAVRLREQLRGAEESSGKENDGSTLQASIGEIGRPALLETQPAAKLQAVLNIAASLGGVLDLESLLRKVAENLFAVFRQADRCFLILKDEASGQLVPRLVHTRYPRGESHALFSRSIVRRCLESLEALLSEDVPRDRRFERSYSVIESRIRSVMCVPLIGTDGKGFGVIQVDTLNRTEKFTTDDLRLLIGVANQVSTALENVKLHEQVLLRERVERDLELAREVQRSFLPRRAPELSGYEFYSYYRSAQQVGGDYFDFVPLPSHRWAIMLGDVAGKGIAAALLMAKISAEGRFCVLTEARPAVAVARLNDLLLQAGVVDRFVTLAVAVLDPVSHEVTLVNAGHPTPLIYRHATNTFHDGISKDLTGLPLGVVEGLSYESTQVTLAPGDAVVLFSDGVTDALSADSVQFQLKGIYTAIQGGPYSPQAIGQRIVQGVEAHSAGHRQHDDITLVCFGRSPC